MSVDTKSQFNLQNRPARGDSAIRLIVWLGSFVLAAAVALMAMQVILRFGFNAPQTWAEEVDRYLFVWGTYLGSIIALRNDTHIRVTFVVDRAGPRFRALSAILTRIINLFVFVFVAYYGYELAYANKDASFYTLEFMPQIIFYLSVPICMTVMAIYVLLPSRKGHGHR